MCSKTIRMLMTLMIILLLPLLVLIAQETSVLLIEGQQGQARVVQVQGKNYVEVEGLARISGGLLRFAGNQIILTLPSTAKKPLQTEQGATVPPQTDGLSKPFLTAGIETMREILEWHAALKNGIERGYPLSDVWFGNYRRQVQASLKQTEAAASTDTDQRALPRLTNEFNTMNALTDKYLQITASRDYLAPNALNSDPLEQKLSACWQSLTLMASSNQFIEDGSCQ